MKTRKELQYYLEADRISLGIKHFRPRIVGDDIWKYQRALRHYEYWLVQTDSFFRCCQGFTGTLGITSWQSGSILKFRLLWWAPV